MKKTIKMIMKDDTITFEATKGVTNADALVACINLLEIVKEAIESVEGTEKVSLEDFIMTSVRGLRNEKQD